MPVLGKPLTILILSGNLKIFKKYEFTEYDLHRYAAVIRNSWINEHIGIHIAQKIATRAFKAVQKKAFGIAKNVRFKGKNQFDSLEGKNNETQLRFRNSILYWSGLEIPCIIEPDNDLITYGLKHRVKYCRIIRRKINSNNRFYLQLICEGTRIKTEKVSYKGWQKRYGKSINVRAPSMFMSSLKRKAENAGGYLFEFPTQTTKLSQTCHICEEAVKKPLSQSRFALARYGTNP